MEGGRRTPSFCPAFPHRGKKELGQSAVISWENRERARFVRRRSGCWRGAGCGVEVIPVGLKGKFPDRWTQVTGTSGLTRGGKRS